MYGTFEPVYTSRQVKAREELDRDLPRPVSALCRRLSLMSQTRHGNLEGGGDPGALPVALDLSPLILQRIVEEHHNQRRTTTRRWSMRSTTFRGNLPSDAEESEFKDSAWPLYSIYSNIAEDEINRTVERCQRDTDGTLIFVSSLVTPSGDFAHQPGNIEWFILCHYRCSAYYLNPRPQGKLARYLRILPKEHLSASSFWRPKRFPPIDFVCFGRTTCILSPNICNLGKLTLVLEFGSQPFKCHARNDGSELGSSLLRDHSAAMAYTSEASAEPCILCTRISRAILHLGNESYSCLSTFCSHLLHHRWPHLSLQYQSCCLLCGGFVGRVYGNTIYICNSGSVF